jgi:hypothetical protein
MLVALHVLDLLFALSRDSKRDKRIESASLDSSVHYYCESSGERHFLLEAGRAVLYLLVHCRTSWFATVVVEINHISVSSILSDVRL